MFTFSLNILNFVISCLLLALIQCLMLALIRCLLLALIQCLLLALIQCLLLALIQCLLLFLSLIASSNNKTKCSLARKAKGYNGMTLHVMEQPPRFFALT
jgi:hypothetical protein